MMYFNLYQTVLVALSALSSTLFLYVSLAFLRVYLRIRVEHFALFSTSFALLALGQVASVLSSVVEEPRLSLTLFTLSSSLASSAFLVMLFSIVRAGRERILAVLLPTLLVASPDIVAFTLSLVVVVLVRGKHLKGYLTALSVAYLVRGLSSLLIPVGIGVFLLVVSELSKTLATLVFATYHLSKVIKS